MKHIQEFLLQDDTSFFSGLSKEEATKKYRTYARRLHPDLVENAYKGTAHLAFIRLGEMWELYNGKSTQKRHVFQKSTPTTTSKAASHTPSSVNLKAANHTYVFTQGKNIHNYGAFVRTEATYAHGRKKATLYMELFGKSDSTLMDNAEHALRVLNTKTAPHQRNYFVSMLDIFNTTSQSRGMAVSTVPDNFISLAEAAHHGNIKGEVAAWIFRELLVALRITHEQGIINGAITPRNIYVDLAKQKVVLPYWMSSVRIGDRLEFYADEEAGFYHPAALRGNRLNGSIDLRMAAKSIKHVLAEDVPVKMRRFFDACIMSTIPDAAELLQEFSEVTTAAFGSFRQKFAHARKMHADKDNASSVSAHASSKKFSSMNSNNSPYRVEFIDKKQYPDGTVRGIDVYLTGDKAPAQAIEEFARKIIATECGMSFKNATVSVNIQTNPSGVKVHLVSLY